MRRKLTIKKVRQHYKRKYWRLFGFPTQQQTSWRPALRKTCITMWSVLDLTKEFDEVCLLIVQKMTPRGSYNSVDQSQALLSEWGRGEKGLGYCEIPRNLAQPQARHLQRRWQAWTRQGPHLTWIASGLGNQTRPGQQPSSQCQFAEESDCLATEINPDTLVPQPIGTCKRMGGRKVLGLTCDLQMRKMSSTIWSLPPSLIILDGWLIFVKVIY